MRSKLVLIFLLPAVILLVPTSADIVFAHPGRTAADGCHYCKTNCKRWGVAENERHCHGTPKIKEAKQTSKSAAKSKSKNGRK